jgi:hypothetical protein
MYFHSGLYFRALKASLVDQPFHPRRWAYLIGFNLLFWLCWLIVAFGRMLDHVLFPGFRRQKIEEPVFIIAPPRSGTTMTQKLLAKDDRRFLHVKLYHTIFPSVCYYKLFQFLGWIDDQSGLAVSRFATWLERKFFSAWNDQHPLRFTEPEEDDGFFVYTMVTEAIYLLFPQVNQLWEAGFADDLPAEERRKVMTYYRSCLQRLLYASGRGRILLSKATQFSGSIESIMEEFPDAKVITIVRHPRQAIASHVSVFYSAWVAHSPEIRKDGPESREYAALAAAWYRHLFKHRGALPADRYYCVRYTDLARDPRSVLLALYQHFCFQPSADFLQVLDEAARFQSEFQSRHRYCLEDFGLDRAWLRQELGPILDFYQLDEASDIGADAQRAGLAAAA